MTCAVPGCDRPHIAKGKCRKHYNAHYYRNNRTRRRITAIDEWRVPKPTPLALFPRYPGVVANQLARLAESNPTPAEYERRKAAILANH